MKILIVGFGCNPYAGSEPGTTWNWAWHLALEHQVWALVHPEYRESVEQYLRDNPNPNLTIVFVKVPDPIDPWRHKVSERGTRLSYVLWQWVALRKARELHSLHQFDIVHQVTMGTIGVPSPLWRLPIPFVWGSLGGGQTAPVSFKEYFGSEWKSELLRTVRVRSLPLIPALRRAARKSALVLATNYETQRLVEKAGGRRVRFFLDCGTLADWLAPSLPTRGSTDLVTLLWSGRIEARKGLILALEALAQLKELPLRLIVTGRGPQLEACKERARSLRLDDHVRFLGFVPREEFANIFRQADVLLFTSLRDSSGSVVLEAMAQGLPVLILNHQGVGAFVPEEAGIKVPVTKPSQTIDGIAHGISRLCASPRLREEMGKAGWSYARTQTWDRKAHQIVGWYRECLEQSPQ